MKGLLYVLGALVLVTVTHGFGLSGTVYDFHEVKVLKKDSFNPMYSKDFNYVITFPEATGYVVLMKVPAYVGELPTECGNTTETMWNITLSHYHPSCQMVSGYEYKCRGEFSFDEKKVKDMYHNFMLVNCHSGLYGVTYEITDQWGPPITASSSPVSIASALTVSLAALLSYFF